MIGPAPHSHPFVGFFGDRNAEKSVGPVPTGTLAQRRQVRVPDDRQNGAGDDVPVVVDVDRDDRLDIEDFLRPRDEVRRRNWCCSGTGSCRDLRSGSAASWRDLCRFRRPCRPRASRRRSTRPGSVEPAPACRRGDKPQPTRRGSPISRPRISAIPRSPRPGLQTLAAANCPASQSPAIPPRATPVIFPAASKPNRRLVASPRGKTNLSDGEGLVAVRLGLDDFGAQRRRAVAVEVVRYALRPRHRSPGARRRPNIASGRSGPPSSR